jgi:ArsR family transcriptional regulator
MVRDKIFELHAEVCKTLSNPLRLQIISELQDGEKTVSTLTKALRMRQANTSQHLAVLRHKGVLATRKEGPNVYYRIANPKIIKACNLIREVLLEQIQSNQSIVASVANDRTTSKSLRMSLIKTR